MAEETMQETAEQAEAAAATDWQAEAERWKAQSREWEKRSKANKQAADELERLKAEQMTEQQKAEARAERAEAELAKMVAKSEHDEAARRVSEKSGVPLELLAYCEDEAAMEAFASDWSKSAQTVHAAASASGQRIVRGGDAPKTNGEVFADFAHDMFGI